jgi:exopolysaccharide biosynthesis polyprenyl glycosylphosphotransferase
MRLADLGLVCAAWLLAYGLRFGTGLPAPLGVPELSEYAEVLLVVGPLWWVLLGRYGLYEPKRLSSLLPEALDVLRVTALGVLMLVGISFFVRSYSYSRGVVVIFSALAPLLLIGLRLVVRGGLRALRRRGYNLRYALVVGAGRLAEELIGRIQDHPHAGVRVVGVVADGAVGGSVRGVPVVGGYNGVKQALQLERIDQVIIALPREDWTLLDKILGELDDEVASVRFAPDLLQIMTLRSSVENLDGLPIISLRESPLVGWASVQKRAVDLLGSAIGLALTLPLQLAIAAAIYATSGGPVLYSQRRMGLDGKLFTMWKFRSMSPDAEVDGGAVWASRDDPRRTRIGAVLRRYNLDELPQLWNVLRGDMSLVGPRPERPELIEEFKSEIPGYMLRHKVKAGLTGWAQVHGWRGNTSLHERIEHDIYYIQNWSMSLDAQILLMTLWSGASSRNAY